jgi:hypothetical protein
MAHALTLCQYDWTRGQIGYATQTAHLCEEPVFLCLANLLAK